MVALIILGSWLASWHWDGIALREHENPATYLVGRDFANFWMMGKAAQQPDPGDWYDWEHYNAALRAALLDGKDYALQQLSYPPTLFLIMLPFGALPYYAALGLFWLAGIGTLVAVLQRLNWTRDAMLVLLVAPASVAALISGQLAFLLVAPLLMGFTLLEKRPWLAGLLFGLLSLKPHFALLLPIALLAGQHGRALLAAILTTLFLLAATTWVFGIDIWQQFFSLGIPAQHTVLEEPPRNIMAWMPTWYMDARAAGLDYQTAMAIQATGLLGGMILVAWAFAKPRDPHWRLLLFTAACLMASPYVMAYDTLAFMAALVAVIHRHGWPGNHWGAALLYFFPLLHYFATIFGFPGTAWLPLIAVLIAVREMKRA